MSTNESVPLYRDGRHYDALNSFLVADIPFYKEEARKSGGAVLELACGTGRLTIPIAQAGVEIVGLDLSPSMLAHARTKAEASGVEIEFVEDDCRSFELRRKFGLIFMAFNSMQHLHDYASLAAFFGCVRKHLGEGGRFIFDVFNPKIEILGRASGERRMEREYQDPDGKGRMTFEYSSSYDDAAQVSHIQCYFVRRGPNGEELDVRKEELDLRSFFPQELDLLVRSQGFEIVEKFGDFERQAFSSGQSKQVVVCKSAWEKALFGTGMKWSEITPQVASSGKFQLSLQEIKDWRARQAEQGLPSGLRDYYKTHGLCFECRSSGVVATGWDELDLEYLYSVCSRCDGSGRS